MSRVVTTLTERRAEDFASTHEPDEFNCAVSSSVRSGGVTLTLPQKAVTTMRTAFVNLFMNGLDGALLFITRVLLSDSSAASVLWPRIPFNGEQHQQHRRDHADAQQFAEGRSVLRIPLRRSFNLVLRAHHPFDFHMRALPCGSMLRSSWNYSGQFVQELLPAI
jgi:hypothetical protein